MSETLAALPFHLKRAHEQFTMSDFTTTTERIHGLLRLEKDRLVVQWRLARTTERMGAASMSTDRELEEVREITLPLKAVAGARVRRRWWRITPSLVLRAADLQAFDGVAGQEGLALDHPAELVLRLRRRDRLAAEEFTAELALALAQLDDRLASADARRRLEESEGRAPDEEGPPPPLPGPSPT